MAGGVTFSEMRCVYEIAEATSTSLLIGAHMRRSTTDTDTKSFLIDLPVLWALNLALVCLQDPQTRWWRRHLFSSWRGSAETNLKPLCGIVEVDCLSSFLSGAGCTLCVKSGNARDSFSDDEASDHDQVGHQSA